MEMIHVFLLQLYIGTGDLRRLVSNDMYFRSVIECNYFADQLVKRYGKSNEQDLGTAYCIPRYIRKNSKVNIYD